MVERTKLRPRHASRQKQTGDSAQRRDLRERMCRNWMRCADRRRGIAGAQPIVGGAVQRRFEVEALFVSFAKIVAECVYRSRVRSTFYG